MSYLSGGGECASSEDNDVDGDDNDDNDKCPSVQCLAHQPQLFAANAAASWNPFEFYPHHTLAVKSRGRIHVVPESQIAPLAISSRDGNIASGLGSTVWIGPTTRGPSSMEGVDQIRAKHISSTMMRRARRFHAANISTDALDNAQILEEERDRILAKEHTQLIVSGWEHGGETL